MRQPVGAGASRGRGPGLRARQHTCAVFRAVATFPHDWAVFAFWSGREGTKPGRRTDHVVGAGCRPLALRLLVDRRAKHVHLNGQRGERREEARADKRKDREKEKERKCNVHLSLFFLESFLLIRCSSSRSLPVRATLHRMPRDALVDSAASCNGEAEAKEENGAKTLKLFPSLFSFFRRISRALSFYVWICCCAYQDSVESGTQKKKRGLTSPTVLEFV